MRICLLSAVVLIAVAAADGIEFSGSTSFYGQYTAEDNDWSEIPAEYWRWRLNPMLNIHGIPIAASLFITSEESMQKQNMNRVYIYSSPSSSSSEENTILSWISSIGIGASNSFFSPLTLNGAGISGIDIELEPGSFYFTATGGRNRRPVEPADGDPGTYTRDIYAVKTGVGSPSGNHVHLCFLHGFDKNGSIREDSTFRITPSENWVGSLDWGLVLLDDKLRINTEIAGSMLTRDIRSPGIESDLVPQWLINFSGANISSAFGWALDLSSSFRFSDNYFSTSFKRTGPGFESMGAPFLRNDEIVFEARADRYFLRRQLSAGLWYRRSRDNLLSTRYATSTGNSVGIRTGLAFRGFPRVIISYAPSSSVMEDTESCWIRTSLLSVSADYTRDIAGTDITSAIAFILHDNSAGSGSGDYSSMNMVLRETVSLSCPVIVTGCFSCRRMRTENNSVWKYFSQMRGTWYPSRGLSVTLGGDLATGADEKKTGILLSGGFPISGSLVVNLRGEYTRFSSSSETDYTAAVLGAGITAIW